MYKSELGDGRGREFDWARARQHLATVDAMLSEMNTTPEVILEEVWARRAEQLAAPIDDASTGSLINLAVLRLGDAFYGVDAAYVREIRSDVRVTRLPRVPAWTLGLVNLRGKIYSVIDLLGFLGLPSDVNPTQAPYLAFIESPFMELAFYADELVTVETLPIEALQETSTMLRGGATQDYVTGVISGEIAHRLIERKGLLVVLDLPALLADEQLIINQEKA